MSTTPWRVRVDPRLCEGHALCIDLAPEVFDLSDDDAATCDERPSDALLDKVRASADACPRGAIVIEANHHSSAQDQTERTTLA